MDFRAHAGSTDAAWAYSLFVKLPDSFIWIKWIASLALHFILKKTNVANVVERSDRPRPVATRAGLFGM